MSETRYIVHTIDACDMDAGPIGSSPVCLDYAKAVETARRMRSAYDAAGDDYLLIKVLRRDRTPDTTVERYVYHL